MAGYLYNQSGDYRKALGQYPAKTIMDQIACVSEKAVDDIRQVSRHLPHPFIVGMMANARDLNSARLEVRSPSTRIFPDGEEAEAH